MAPERPVELRHKNVNTWSHLNCDPPVTHSHGLKISRFSQSLEQFECGNCIQDKFTVKVGGRQTHWELRIYPNGYEEDTAGYLSLFVKHKEDPDVKFLLKSQISILDNEGNKKLTCDLPAKVLSSKQMHGTKKFVPREHLMNNPQIYINGSVTFLLEVEICLPDVKTSTNVEKNENVEKSKIDSQNKAIKNDIVDSMKSDFAGLLSSEDHCDVVIKCQNQEFKCHVAILAARSPVFGAMFQHKMTESVSRKIEIPDLFPATVKSLLDYIYSGKFDTDSDEDLFRLLSAADKYGLMSLRVACEYHLIRTLCDTNCVDLLILANTHTASHLEEACLKFIVTNLATIMSTECWKTKLANHADIMAKILQATATAQTKHKLENEKNSKAKRRRKELTSFMSIVNSSDSSEDSDFINEDDVYV